MIVEISDVSAAPLLRVDHELIEGCSVTRLACPSSDCALLVAARIPSGMALPLPVAKIVLFTFFGQGRITNKDGDREIIEDDVLLLNLRGDATVQATGCEELVLYWWEWPSAKEPVLPDFPSHLDSPFECARWSDSTFIRGTGPNTSLFTLALGSVIVDGGSAWVDFGHRTVHVSPGDVIHLPDLTFNDVSLLRFDATSCECSLVGVWRRHESDAMPRLMHYPLRPQLLAP